jgi:hypothetical protein
MGAGATLVAEATELVVSADADVDVSLEHAEIPRAAMAARPAAENALR